MQTKSNLELKHHCADFPAVRKVLVSIGAKKEVVKKQTDHFFDLPRSQKKRNGRLKLRLEQTGATLIYYERPAFVAGKDTGSTVALFAVDRYALAFLEKALGTVAVVLKTREVWRKGDTVFHLDEVNGVGKIFEIEMQKRAEITERDRRKFADYRAQLMPHLGKAVKVSNVDLVLKAQKQAL